MRKSAFAIALGITAAALAQDPGKQQEPGKDEQARIRAERAAGGVGNITPEERANADVGAGLHTHRTTKPARREPREEPGEQSARGATRDPGLESGNAPAPHRRP
jgi:hypothetical protein